MTENRERLDEKMMQFLHLHRETMRRCFQSCGLFNGHPRVLFFIRRNDGITQRELAEQMNVAPATVAVSVRRLETAGLVKRVRDEKDGRVFHLFLTPKGEEIDDRCRQGKDFLIERVYEGFSKEEEQQFINLMDKMIGNLERAYQSIPEIPETEEERAIEG